MVLLVKSHRVQIVAQQEEKWTTMLFRSANGSSSAAIPSKCAFVELGKKIKPKHTTLESTPQRNETLAPQLGSCYSATTIQGIRFEWWTSLRRRRSTLYLYWHLSQFCNSFIRTFLYLNYMLRFWGRSWIPGHKPQSRRAYTTVLLSTPTGSDKCDYFTVFAIFLRNHKRRLQVTASLAPLQLMCLSGNDVLANTKSRMHIGRLVVHEGFG